jgi:DNA-binding transcriptional MocR family regulator
MRAGEKTPSWLPDIAAHGGAVYRALHQAIEQAIRSGTLQPGDRLPTHRFLAGRLGVDLTTVTRGYGEAQRAGLIEATVGRGTYVRAGPQNGGERAPLVDMTMNLPPLPAEPSLRTLVQDSMVKLFRHQDPAALLSYRGGAGSADEREAGALWLAPTLGKVDPQRVLLCAGAQAALLALLSTLASPGDLVLAERIAYPGLRALAAQLGLRLGAVDMDAEGMLPESLDRLCRERSPRLIYCNPTIQNPTTATMPEPRRQAIVAIARRHKLPIIEDDTYGLLPEAPIPAMAQLAPDLVYHVATTAKTLSPSLRIAYLIVPDLAEASRLTAALRATSLMASGLLSGLVTLWIRSGQAHALLAAIRGELTRRQAIARDVLGEAAAAHPQGLHTWLSLPPHWRSADFTTHLRQRGLAVVPCSAFATEGEPPNAVRISLGAAASAEVLLEALKPLPAALRQHVLPEFSQLV